MLFENKLSSKDIRRKTIKFACETKAGHLAPSLSSVEMLTVLFNNYLKFDSKNPRSADRDRLIFSKGHGAYAYYIILNELGILPDEELKRFNTKNATIKGCLVQNNDFMIEASTGSLGHGLPLAVGMALAFKLNGAPNKVVCIVGDGEMQEGSNFEALQLAICMKLDNLLLIVDANGLQAMDFIADVGIDINRLGEVLKAFVGVRNYRDLDGHNEEDLAMACSDFWGTRDDDVPLPFIVLARTTKGKGFSMIENQSKYHYRCPVEDGYVFDEKDFL